MFDRISNKDKTTAKCIEIDRKQKKMKLRYTIHSAGKVLKLKEKISNNCLIILLFENVDHYHLNRHIKQFRKQVYVCHLLKKQQFSASMQSLP